jgi:hypothetical protein
MEKLRQSLQPLGIEPRLEIREIDDKTFRANPSESNRVWIAGRPMEEWLGARVGVAVAPSAAHRSAEPSR